MVRNELSVEIKLPGIINIVARRNNRNLITGMVGSYSRGTISLTIFGNSATSGANTSSELDSASWETTFTDSIVSLAQIL